MFQSNFPQHKSQSKSSCQYLRKHLLVGAPSRLLRFPEGVFCTRMPPSPPTLRVARGVTQQTLRLDVGEGHGWESWCDEIKTSDLTVRLIDCSRQLVPTVKDVHVAQCCKAQQMRRFLWNISTSFWSTLSSSALPTWLWIEVTVVWTRTRTNREQAFPTHELQC